MKNIRTKAIFVPGSGWMQIFQNIYRIDNPGTGQHGWQIRIKRRKFKACKWFSDGNNNPSISLEPAVDFLNKCFPGSIYAPYSKEISTKLHKSGTVGVGLIRIIKKGRKNREYYYQVIHPKHGESSVRMYIGTENTFTLSRARAAKAKARTLRRKLEIDYANSKYIA